MRIGWDPAGDKDFAGRGRTSVDMRRFVLFIWVALTLVLGVASAGVSRAATDGPCTDINDRACIHEVVATYIDAQADSSLRNKIRAAPDIVRWENGTRNADGIADIQSGQTDDDSGFTGLLGDSELDRMFVDTEYHQAVVYWLMDVTDPVSHTQTATAHIAERFLLTNACGDQTAPCIKEIEAIFCVGGGKEESRPAQKSGDQILCFRQSP